jgi:CheY-like chemotaxis protein
VGDMAGVPPGRQGPKPPTFLLCIDDQADYLPVRKAFLESHGYRVFIASSGQQGLGMLARHKIDAVVLDYHMPEMDGEEVAREIRRTRPRLPIILLTGFPDIPQALKSIVNAMVAKGQSPLSLLEAIEATMREIVLEPRTPAVSGESIQVMKKRIHRIRETAAEHRKRIGRR